MTAGQHPKRTGVILSLLGHSIERRLEHAQLADDLGFDSIWHSQLANEQDASVALTAYALRTRRIGLGIAVLPIYCRHPTSAVAMAATLDTVSGGRFRLGLGVGTELTVSWMWGLKQAPPVGAMREYVSIVRESLRDGKAHVEGSHFTARWRYSAPARADIPILVAALGPRMLELAGEVADGVIPWMVPPAYVRDHVIPRVRIGRARAGLDMDGFEVAIPMQICLTSEPERFRDELRKTVRFYARLPAYRHMFVTSGLGDLGVGQIEDRVLLELAGIGGELDARSILERYREAGCTMPIVSPQADVPATATMRETMQVALG